MQTHAPFTMHGEIQTGSRSRRSSARESQGSLWPFRPMASPCPPRGKRSEPRPLRPSRGARSNHRPSRVVKQSGQTGASPLARKRANDPSLGPCARKVHGTKRERAPEEAQRAATGCDRRLPSRRTLLKKRLQQAATQGCPQAARSSQKRPARGAQSTSALDGAHDLRL